MHMHLLIRLYGILLAANLGYQVVGEVQIEQRETLGHACRERGGEKHTVNIDHSMTITNTCTHN